MTGKLTVVFGIELSPSEALAKTDPQAYLEMLREWESENGQ